MNALLLLLALCGGVELTAPERADPGDLVVLEASGGSAYAWTLVGPREGLLPVDGGSKAVFASGRPGVYTVVLAGLEQTEAGPKLTQVRRVVTIGTPEPEPAPAPAPGPAPPPPGPAPAPVVQGRVWATLVLPEALTPDLAALRTSPAIRQAAARLDVVWRSYLAIEAEAGPYAAAAKQLPAVLLQTLDGKVVGTIAAPTEASVVAEFKRLRGQP